MKKITFFSQRQRMQHIVHVYETIYFITDKVDELNTDNTTVVNADGGAMQDNDAKSYDYAPTHKTIAFTKNREQTIAKSICDGPCKESDEAFWLTSVSTGGYREKGVNNVDFRYREMA